MRDGVFARELAFADRFVGELVDALPASATVLVTSDHGQIHLEAESWIDIAAAAEPVVDEIVPLLRRADVLVSRADIQHQAVGRAPVVLRVDVLLFQLIVQRRRAERLGEGVDATGPERRDGGAVVDARSGYAGR